jgi:hypothetical protein
MIVNGYLILEPGADRPYFSHTPPTAYQRKPGAKVYVFSLNVPDFMEVDGVIQSTTSAYKDSR